MRRVKPILPCPARRRGDHLAGELARLDRGELERADRPLGLDARRLQRLGRLGGDDPRELLLAIDEALRGSVQDLGALPGRERTGEVRGVSGAHGAVDVVGTALRHRAERRPVVRGGDRDAVGAGESLTGKRNCGDVGHGWTILPGLPHRFAFLDHPVPIPFAHRGGAGEWPENTMAAFEGARRLGYRYMETDVHATSDGVLVALHDEKLDRLTDRTGTIAELPWSEVRLARVAGTEPIALLEDLLGMGPEVRVNIDVKAEPVIEPLAAMLRRMDAIGRVCVAGFSDRRISAVRRALGAELCTSMGPLDTARLRAASVLPAFVRDRVGPRDVPCAQVPVRQTGVPVADAAFIREAHRRGVQVHVWTIDDPNVMATLLDLRVDGIMTDRPAVLKTVLAARGQWVD